MINNLDADHLWKDYPIAENLIIPVVPTSQVFIKVKLSGMNADSAALTITMDDIGARKDDVFVGFLNPGEGRGIIRQHIINWFDVKFASIRQCNFQSHGPKAEAEWQARSVRSSTNFLDRYSVWSFGMCVFCFTRTGDQDDEDLIPQDDDKKTSLWKQKKLREQAIEDARKRSQPSYAGNVHTRPNKAVPKPDLSVVKKPRPGKALLPSDDEKDPFSFGAVKATGDYEDNMDGDF
jgi:hypothetical protein